MIVCTAGYKVKATVKKTLCKSLCILNDLSAVLLELRLESLAEAYSLTCDNVHKRSALCTWEDSGIDLLCKILVICKDKTASGASEGLVSSCCNDIGIRNGRLMLTCCNKTCDVSHIYHKICAYSS